MSRDLNQKDLPKIRQTLFIVDKNRKYLFDVNQNITIHNLKKMLIAAANLGKVGLRIFHQGVEYTDKDRFCLDELFPELQLVEFTLQISYEDVSELDSLIKIKLKDYCPDHSGKYPYFYCYDCEKSLCSECLKSGLHKGHNYKEKYDYLLNSKYLVEQLFYDLNDIIKDAKEINGESVDNLRAKITVQFFPTLVQMVKAIEEKLVGLIDTFLEKEKGNLENIKANVTLLKDHCAEGLDKLKDEIEIQDLIIDEEVFLTFDKKFKEISKEKAHVQSDVDEFKRFSESFILITNTVEKIYKEIHAFLEKYLNSSVFTEIQTKIRDQTISLVSKKEIFDRLLSDVKRTPLRSADKKVKPSAESYNKFMKRVADAAIQYKNQNIGMEVENEEPEDHDCCSVISNVVPGTKQILFYRNETGKLSRKNIEFGPLHGIKNFLLDCAWVNFDNKIYISGGNENGLPNKSFFVYDPRKGTFIRLPDMKVAHASHSMYATKEFIYVIGGETVKCEKYNLQTREWTMMADLCQIQKHPVLYINQNYLYSFFGLDENNNYTDFIQRIQLKNDKCKWISVFYSRNDIDMRILGCGIIKVDENEVYFLGGKDKDGLRKTTMKYDFGNHSLTQTDFTINSGAYFMDTTLIALGEGFYGNFSLEEKGFFMKFTLEVHNN